MKKPSRLELHRAVFRKKKGKHVLLRFAELDDDEKRLIADDLFERVATVRREGKDPDSGQISDIYSLVMFDWGVMCPHPQKKRLYGGELGSEVPQPDYTYYTCKSCGCAVVNEEWMAVNAKSEVLKGYSIHAKKKEEGDR